MTTIDRDTDAAPAQPEGVPLVDAATAWSWLRDGQELALLDVRELRPYSEGHILLAAPASLSTLELTVSRLVPRRGVRVVLVDDDGTTRAQRAAAVLAGLGYTAVHVLEGGLAAWREAGFDTVTGTNVVSKAFGEFLEDTYGTPRITARALKQKLDAGEDLVVIDTRPLEEFRAISIPGGIDAPGAELIARVHDLVTSPEQLVVVNCAGRTRAIVGAQALINAGLPNPVVALENGTSAWLVEGFDPARGSTAQAPAPSPEARSWARGAAEQVATRFGVRRIDDATLAQFEAEAGEHTLYLLDVRDPAEHAAGHLPGSVGAPGGQVVQALDQYVATQHARIVLLDDGDGVRALGTAAWLEQIGVEGVVVNTTALASRPLVTAAAEEDVDVLGTTPRLSSDELEALLAGGTRVVVVDVGSSRSYLAGHVPGARHVLRSHLAADLGALAGAEVVVVTSPDGRLAGLAASDLEPLVAARVVSLEGGTDAWRASGRSLEESPSALFDEAADYAGPPTRDLEARRAHLRRYVQWGREIVAQIEREGTVRFRAFS